MTALGPVADNRQPGLGRVLVLDDDEASRDLAFTALTAAGFETEGLDHPRDFFDRLEGFSPDVLVLDRRLPGDSGDMLAVRLRASLGPRRPPVVLWSAEAGRETEATLLTAFIDDFVVKCQQSVDILVQRVVKLAGWDYVAPDLMLRRKDGIALYRGARSAPLTAREIDFLYLLGQQGAAGVGRAQGRLVLLLDAGLHNKHLLNRALSRFKSKLPPPLRAALVTLRGKGWRLDSWQAR